LTRPGFTEAAAEKGTTQYVVMSVNGNGQSVRSAVASVTISKAPAPRMTMH
jgi:hypothetical protein